MSRFDLIFNIRKLLKSHQKEAASQDEKWNNRVSNLREKNAKLTEQLNILLIAYKAEMKRKSENSVSLSGSVEVNPQQSEQIQKLERENSELKKALKLAGATAGAVIVHDAKTNASKDIAGENVPDGFVASELSKDETDELKAQIEELKTQLASAEANTVKEEAQVSEKLIEDQELLEKFYATQLQLEKLEDQEEEVTRQQNEIEALKLKLETTAEAKDVLERKIGETLQEMQTADKDEMTRRIAEVEEENLLLSKVKDELAIAKSELESQLDAERAQIEQLNKKIKADKKLKNEATRNPKRAATAVAAVAVRGTR